MHRAGNRTSNVIIFKTQYLRAGRTNTNLNLAQTLDQDTKSGMEFMRKISISAYESCTRMAGCDTPNGLFCFPCLIYLPEVMFGKEQVLNLNNLWKGGKARVSSRYQKL